MGGIRTTPTFPFFCLIFLQVPQQDFEKGEKDKGAAKKNKKIKMAFCTTVQAWDVF